MLSVSYFDICFDAYNSTTLLFLLTVYLFLVTCFLIMGEMLPLVFCLKTSKKKRIYTVLLEKFYRKRQRFWICYSRTKRNFICRSVKSHSKCGYECPWRQLRDYLLLSSCQSAQSARTWSV